MTHKTRKISRPSLNHSLNLQNRKASSEKLHFINNFSRSTSFFTLDSGTKYHFHEIHGFFMRENRME
jgi:hypothetical protein